MAFIVRAIIEAKIEKLYREREYAFQNKDYHQVWVLDTKINKNKNRLVTCCY